MNKIHIFFVSLAVICFSHSVWCVKNTLLVETKVSGLEDRESNDFKRPFLPSRRWVSKNKKRWPETLLNSKKRNSVIKVTSALYGQNNLRRELYPYYQKIAFRLTLEVYLRSKNSLGDPYILNPSLRGKSRRTNKKSSTL